MKVKNLINKTCSKYNPLAIMRRNNMRKNLININSSLLCPNCLGGILFHDLGLKFYSPTVNLMMTQRDFLEFVVHLHEYIDGEFEFYEQSRDSYPRANLKTKTGENIHIHFTHYHSKEDALEKWMSRKERIQWDNLFVCCVERDGLSKEDIIALGQLPVKGLVVFTAHDYKDIPYTLFLPEYEKEGAVGNLLLRNRINDSRVYEKYFDFVKWFNEADGLNFDITRFVKRKRYKMNGV